MPRIPPTDFVDGDVLEPWHLNFIFSFIRRWMKFDASPPLSFDSSGESPPHLSLLGLDDLVPIQTPSGGIAAATSLTARVGDRDAPARVSGRRRKWIHDDRRKHGDLLQLLPDRGGRLEVRWAKWRGPHLYLVTWAC